ncbi:MAG TPA: Asd/ArgC dimerization domain-containing protein [Candidatus Acidoferrum sp.]|jgi:aspartate-semialdehyde dehydrogenase|nr:Asd/ArgC dimerization domain-containing protein [Candidatus Acidoferrum sp.]
MSPDRNSQRIVIAGASSLLGGELKTLLEESRFAGWDLRLVDEENVAGTLTEAGGEAAVIQRVEEDTFRGAKYAFLAGSTAFGKLCLGPAREAGATIVDFTHATLSDPDATPWFPKIEALTGKSVAKNAKTFSVFSAGGTAAASLALVLQKFGLQRLVTVLFRPVSDTGRNGIEELETQTSQLLSFQSIGSRVFGTQTAFNLLQRFGSESKEDLQREGLEIRAEVSAAVGDVNEDAKISLNLIHAPVFYGLTFSACADLGEGVDSAKLIAACKEAGWTVTGDAEAGPSNVSVAGESQLFMSEPRADLSRAGAWWFWGAGDNLRLPAASGIKLADWLEG